MATCSKCSASSALASGPVHHQAPRGHAYATFRSALHRQHQRWERQSRPCVATAANAAASTPAPRTGADNSPLQTPVQLLWYKRDLRLDDHPGWQQSLGAGADGSPAAATPLPLPVPVFVFDPLRYAPLVLPAGGAEALCGALASLDRSLRQRGGGGLVVRIGRWEQVLPALVAELGGGGGAVASIVAEQEVEAEWSAGVAAVAAAMPQGVDLRLWSAPLLHGEHADDYAKLRQRQPGVNAPLDAPAALPPLPAALSHGAGGDACAGLGISSAELRQLAASAYLDSLHPLLRPAGDAAAQGWRDWEWGAPSNPSQPDAAAAAPGGAWESELASEIASSEGQVLAALGSYLRHLEAAAGGGDGISSSGSESDPDADAADGSAVPPLLAAAIAAFDAPATPNGCFPALFGRALALGVVSRRRVLAEASAVLQQQQELELPPGAGPLQLLGWLLSSSGGVLAVQRRERKAAAAAAAVRASDFHEHGAAERQGRQVHGGAELHHWRWRGGLLTDYLYAPPPAAAADAADSRPAIVLVHGFGAFSEHWRDNVAALAAAGYHVYAPTLPGYGFSEKPVLPYGQDAWSAFVADFVLQVVRRPVVLAGNSIGGFIAASVAADIGQPGAAVAAAAAAAAGTNGAMGWQQSQAVVQGLVLVNSAGRIVPGYAPPAQPPAPAAPPPPFVVNVVSSALFAFLEGGVQRQLRRVYPVRPQRADEWLGGRIGRAARDPGALGVFRSVFYLPPPRPLNYLVAQRYGGPTLVLQGLKDPLNNAPARAQELGEQCANVQVVTMDAGHCPHDEDPSLFNRHLLHFIERSVLLQPQAAAPPPLAPIALQ